MRFLRPPGKGYPNTVVPLFKTFDALNINREGGGKISISAINFFYLPIIAIGNS